jgi:hypothetical protein
MDVKDLAALLIDLAGLGKGLRCDLRAGPDGYQLHIEVGPAGEGQRAAQDVPAPPPADKQVGTPPAEPWLFLSDLEHGIVDALRARGEQPDPLLGEWLTREALAEILREAATGRIRDVLANLGERRIVETHQRRGYRLRVDGEPPGWGDAAGEACGGALAFSRLERAILQALPAEGWMPAQALAEGLGEPCSSEFRTVLRNLAERGAVASAQSRGFRRLIAVAG